MVTFRSEFEPLWIGRAHVTALTVGRLAQFEVDWIIDQVIGSNPLPASIRLDIIERSDGIPLLVDETTKAVLEAGGQSVAEHAVAAVPPPAAAPATFHASLIARLDQLGPAKGLAQIGRRLDASFRIPCSWVARKPEAELQTALDHLIRAGLLFREGVPPHATGAGKPGLR
jgi:predicted ATPase